MVKKYKLWGVIIIGLFLLGLGITQLPTGLEIAYSEVKPQTWVNSFAVEGVLCPQETKSLYAPLSLTVLELHVQEGDWVEEGELLAVLDTAELALELKQLRQQKASYEHTRQIELAQAQLEKQKATLQLATLQTELAQIEQLYKLGALSHKNLKEIETKVHLAEIALAQQTEILNLLEIDGREEIQTQIELGEYRMAKATLTAPVAGLIGQLNFQVGERASPEQPLLTVFQGDALFVECFVPVAQAPLLQKEEKVTLEYELPIQTITFAGFIDGIAPKAVTQISPLGLEEEKVKVKLKFTPPENVCLLPGAKLNVEFITAQKEDVLVLPLTYLFPYEGQEAVWLIKEGKAIPQPIQKGITTNNEVIIQQGLNVGDLVITKPQQAGLKPGRKIKTSPSF